MQLTPDAILQAYGRTLWVIASSRVCPVHKLSLVRPPEVFAKHAFVEAWLLWMFEVMGEIAQEVSARGGLSEEHIVYRLTGEQTDGRAQVSRKIGLKLDMTEYKIG